MIWPGETGPIPLLFFLKSAKMINMLPWLSSPLSPSEIYFFGDEQEFYCR